MPDLIPFATRQLGNEAVNTVNARDCIIDLALEITLLRALADAANAPTEKEAFTLLNKTKTRARACGGYTETFSALAESVFTHLWWQWKYSKQPSEKKSYPLFIGVLPKLIPGATLTQVRHIKGHFPDFFVDVEGELAPVEIKREPITTIAIAQLARYMKVYNASRGYVVGPELRAPLHAGMKFCAWEPAL